MVPTALCQAFDLNAAIPEPLKSSTGVVLFIVQAGERNIADQKAVDLGLWEQGPGWAMALPTSQRIVLSDRPP